MADYLAIKAFSGGLAHTIISRSPSHAKHDQDNPSEPSTRSETGVAIHDLLLEGVDRIVSIDADDWRTKFAKEARALARIEGKIPLLAKNVGKVKDAVAAATAYLEAGPLAGILSRGKSEQVVIWNEGKAICKARPDLIDKRWHLSVKTTEGSAQPDAWIKGHLSTDGHDVSAMLYERGLAAHKRELETVFLVIEQDAPHGCSLVGLDPGMREFAASKLGRALRHWQACLATGRWPAYSHEIHYAAPTPWQLDDEANRASFDVEAVYQALPKERAPQPDYGSQP